MKTTPNGLPTGQAGGQACQLCQSSFEVGPDEIEFLKKMDFKYGDQIFRIPEPTHCPDCRAQIRTAQRNEKNMYQRKSDLSGKQLVSLYPTKPSWGEPYTIWSQEEWNSDDWDPLDYGRDFDFSRPFFEQFAELHRVVPRPA